MLSHTIGVRLQEGDRELLEKVCKARGEDLSNFIRRSIRKELASLSFYSDEEKKALGLIGMTETKDDLITIPKAILGEILSRLERIEKTLKGKDLEQ